MSTQTPTLTIDGKKYTLDQLSKSAKAQLASLQVAEQEIARLRAQLALAQTARNAYAAALKSELNATPAAT